MKNTKITKILYGAGFCLALPVLLAVWSVFAEKNVRLPVPPFGVAGWALAAAGAALTTASMLQLIRRGKGLPMNIAPPERFVSTGLYALIPHPIYVGFSVMCFGVAWAAGSAAGFWLVAPCAALGCTALVWGYERPDLLARFGGIRPKPLVGLPSASDEPPLAADRISALLLLLLPWLAMYATFIALDIPAHAASTLTDVERSIPVVGWTVVLYSSVYPFAVAVPWFVRSKRELRRLLLAGWWGSAVIFGLFALLPFYAPPRQLLPSDPFSVWIALERGVDTAAAAFPSFHVFWAFIAAGAMYRRRRRGAWLWFGFATLISASCFTTGMHSLADVAAGVGVFFLVRRPEELRSRLLRVAERIANSWKEWRIGKIRVIVHGVYAGLGMAFGTWIIAAVCGVFPAAAVAAGGLIGAALWAQIVEGSSGLLRPFGYYGAIFGGIAAAGVSAAMEYDFWRLLAACALCAPVVQATGRLRCLIQGCCHGREYAGGIVYHRPKSRVVAAGLGGKPLYPTPLYSIAANVALLCVLVKLWNEAAPYSVVAGVYLLGAGFSRFIEEAYRGEPQTATVGGLRLYQWLSVGFVAAGAAVTCISSSVCGGFIFGAAEGICGLAAGVVAFAAMGVDVPTSHRRFSRLTPE